MKALNFFLLFIACSAFSFGQSTAANFNINDCSGTNHDLFTELGAGKVVVICWVMPCSNCASKALAAYNVVQSYTASNPGQVVYYIADDVANTSCTNLKNWCDTNVALGCTAISNTNVSMNPYGSAGMPKTVVLGGPTTHSVYFNANGGAAGVTANLQSAVNQALLDITTAGIKENKGFDFELNVYPNPADKLLNIKYTLKNSNPIDFAIFSISGKIVREKKIDSNLTVGKNETIIDIEGINSGMYYLKITTNGCSQTIKLNIIN